MIQIGNITIEKVCDESGDFWHFSYKDLNDPGYEYREYSNGTKFWFRDGEFHREDGPAIIYSDGSEKWLRNGKFHREDGPAIIRSNGVQSWCLNNKYYSEKKFKEEMKRRNA